MKRGWRAVLDYGNPRLVRDGDETYSYARRRLVGWINEEIRRMLTGDHGPDRQFAGKLFAILLRLDEHTPYGRYDIVGTGMDARLVETGHEGRYQTMREARQELIRQAHDVYLKAFEVREYALCLAASNKAAWLATAHAEDMAMEIPLAEWQRRRVSSGPEE